MKQCHVSSSTKKMAICQAMVYSEGNGTVVERPTLCISGWKKLARDQQIRDEILKIEFRTILQEAQC